MSFDIVIVGAGIAGVTVAECLAPHASVCLLEREDHPGYHASGRSAAMFLEGYGNADVRALNRASRGYLVDWYLLQDRGVLLISRTGQDPVFDAESVELGAREISPTAAVELVPILREEQVHRAGFTDQGFDVDTDRMLQGALRVARDHGAVLRARSDVTSIAHQGATWTVETSAGPVSAPLLVNASGAWADEVAGLAGIEPLGLQPMRRSVARIALPDGIDSRGWPMMLGVGNTWFAKPDAGEMLVSPSEEDPVPPQDAWAEDMVLAEGIARYEDVVSTPVRRMLSNWAGLRTFAPDRTPVVGRDAREPGFIWCAGQGGYGFQTAAAISSLTADIALGRAPALGVELVNALSPLRFSQT